MIKIYNYVFLVFKSKLRKINRNSVDIKNVMNIFRKVEHLMSFCKDF